MMSLLANTFYPHTFPCFKQGWSKEGLETSSLWPLTAYNLQKRNDRHFNPETQSSIACLATSQSMEKLFWEAALRVGGVKWVFCYVDRVGFVAQVLGASYDFCLASHWRSTWARHLSPACLRARAVSVWKGLFFIHWPAVYSPTPLSQSTLREGRRD